MRFKAPPFPRLHHQRTPRRRHSASSDDERALVEAPNRLERALGNRALRALLHSGEADTGGRRDRDGDAREAPEPDAGRPLDAGVRSRMERALGADLRDVRIHTDGDAAAEVRRHGAEAMAYGRHVAFEHGRYRPGTPLGDALLAHELAHTIQQRQGAASGHASSVPQPRLEADANRSALGALGALWGRAAGAASRAAAGVGPRLGSGTQMQFLVCEAQPAYQAPEYLGPHSRQALEDINRILESGEALSQMIVIGSVLTLATSSPGKNLASGSYDVTPQAEALRAVPVIVRSQVIVVITYLLAEHENDMNERERRFWRNILRQFQAL